MSHFDWPITNTNLKLRWLPKIKAPCATGVCPPWRTYEAEKGRTLGKEYGIKVWFYWNILRNTLGTLWEQKTPKKPLSPQPKRKQIGPLSIYVDKPSPWLHQIFISKTVCHHFSLGLRKGMGCTLYGRI
jgi:hypothetical protein